MELTDEWLQVRNRVCWQACNKQKGVSFLVTEPPEVKGRFRIGLFSFSNVFGIIVRLSTHMGVNDGQVLWL